jgi:hypothetical protein
MAKRQPITKEYHVADFETTAKAQYERDGCTRVYLWYIEDIYNDDIHAIGLDIADFWRYITSKVYEPTRRIIFFHNLGFDILFLEYYLLSIGYESIMDKGGYNQYTILRDDMGQVYGMTVYGLENLVIEFRDSFKLLQSSVDKLPNIRGLEKLKGYDYQKLRDEVKLEDFTPFDIQYVKHDVWKVKDVLKALLPSIGDYLTIASSSYNDWYKRYIEHDKWAYANDFPVINDDLKPLLRNAYNGGLVILNEAYRGKILTRPVVSYDVNSLYPSVMRYKPLPKGKPHRILTYNNLKYLISRGYTLQVLCVSVKRMTIKAGYHPYISMTKHYTFTGKQAYPNEITDTVFYWTNVDLDNIVKYYDIDYTIDLDLSYAFKAKLGTFDAYIDHYMAVKEKATVDGDVFMRMFAKYRLNTPYGKFGTRDERTTLTSSLDEIGKIEFELHDVESKKEFYLPIAIFITAWARDVLITAVQAERESFIYADTDSIHCFEDTFKGDIAIDNEKLGFWKFEGLSTKTLFINNKQYIKLIDGKLKRTIASLNKDNHDKVNFDNMYKGSIITKGKKMKKHVKGGYIIVDTDFTFT